MRLKRALRVVHFALRGTPQPFPKKTRARDLAELEIYLPILSIGKRMDTGSPPFLFNNTSNTNPNKVIETMEV